MIVGASVHWRHAHEDGRPLVDLRGVVVALQRAGSPSMWSALVLDSEGRLRPADPENLIVEELPNEPKPRDARAEAGLFAAEAVKTLDEFLQREFPGDEATGEEHEVDHAIRILSELKTELLATIGERDGLKKANDMLIAKAKRGEKKPPGPAGPGEDAK